MPKLIVLNGASSAGKTVTAQALLKALGEQCVCTGLDALLDRVQPFGPEPKGLYGQLRRNVRIVGFQVTDGRLRLFKTLHREVVGLVESRRDVVVETSLMDQRALYDAAQCFAPLGGLFVGMKPPLAISEEWESQRPDRSPGQARKHYDLVHAHGIYDLVLDPSTMTPDQCATAILQHLETTPPNAFRQLLEKLNEP